MSQGLAQVSRELSSGHPRQSLRDTGACPQLTPPHLICILLTQFSAALTVQTIFQRINAMQKWVLFIVVVANLLTSALAAQAVKGSNP